MTDEDGQYAHMGKHFAGHDYTTHSKGEYGRGSIHTNTVEGFYSVFKRGMTGVYQHCSEAHLHRYVAEFDFRYNNRVRLGVNDTERTLRVIHGSAGKPAHVSRTWSAIRVTGGLRLTTYVSRRSNDGFTEARSKIVRAARTIMLRSCQTVGGRCSEGTGPQRSRMSSPSAGRILVLYQAWRARSTSEASNGQTSTRGYVRTAR
jgi:hypothetical protein